MTPVAAPTADRPRLWPWLTAAILLAVAVYAPLFPDLVREWAEFPSLSHGFAIPVIAAYLIWARRRSGQMTVAEPSAWGLPVLVLGLTGLVVGVRGEEPFLARISLPVTLFGLTLFVGGRQAARQAWPGIAYLVFMIPLPYATLKLITYRSRLIDAAVSAAALDWLGVPVLREGVMLYLPNITLEVADDCSSIPAIAALLSLGVAYAFLVARPLALRVSLIVATIPFAIGANMIRIITTAAAAYHLGPWTLHTTYHMFNGTVNFLLTWALLLTLDALLLRLGSGRAR